MAGVRTTPGITNKEVNPINRAVHTFTGYIGNVGKEIKETAQVWKAGFDIAGPTGYPSGAAKDAITAKQNALDKKLTSAEGQLFGAVFQGRRYKK